jgi:hypothetical protein
LTFAYHFTCALTRYLQMFREQLLACDQDPEGIRYAKKFDLATRGLLNTIKRFRVMKSIVMKKTRLEMLKNKYVNVLKILGKDAFDSVLDLMSLKSLSEMDLDEKDGQKSSHQLLEEAAHNQMTENNQKIEEIIARQKEKADFLAGIKTQKKEIVIVSQEGPPVVKKPAFLRRVITSIKPSKEDIAPIDASQPTAQEDAAARPKVRMSLAQVQAMLLDQSREAQVSATIAVQPPDAVAPDVGSAAGVAALAQETGQSLGPRPPSEASRLMQAMGSVRSRLRANASQNNPPPPPSASEQM